MKTMKYIMICVLALSNQQASAQFGNILNRLEYSAKSKLEGAAVDAAEKAGRSALDSAKKKAKKSKKDKAEAQTWTYGDHTYTMKGNLTADKYKKDAFGEVTFTNIPSDYNEFEALYSEFLGRTPHGTAAMIPMAMEMYARDREMGKKCIELLSYPSNVNSIISRLKDKFGSDYRSQRLQAQQTLYGDDGSQCEQAPGTANCRRGYRDVYLYNRWWMGYHSASGGTGAGARS